MCCPTQRLAPVAVAGPPRQVTEPQRTRWVVLILKQECIQLVEPEEVVQAPTVASFPHFLKETRV
jgi:hypothetical protein